MKYLRGYIVAAVFLVLTIALTTFCAEHTILVDMVYPYATRMIQTSLAEWSSGIDICLWQLLVVVLGVLALASIVAMILLRWNFFQWFGWVLTVCSFLYMMHTGIYGLNYYAGSLSDDIRLEEAQKSITTLVQATTYFRDKANELSTQVPRDDEGDPDYPGFDELANMAGEGFKNLTLKDYYSVFSGSTVPVKQLGWADMYTSMGITGVTMPLTGEAAVNPQTPVVAMPFVMCHEMCHRTCIAPERDANLGAYLACISNSDPIYQYSGYFMAFRYCYNALVSVGTATSGAAARDLLAGATEELTQDLNYYKTFFAEHKDQTATNIANTANDTYIKVSGDEAGVSSYSQVSDLLIDWYVQEIYLPQHIEEEEAFDPMDKVEVDLTDNPR